MAEFDEVLREPHFRAAIHRDNTGDRFSTAAAVHSDSGNALFEKGRIYRTAHFSENLLMQGGVVGAFDAIDEGQILYHLLLDVGWNVAVEFIGVAECWKTKQQRQNDSFFGIHDSPHNCLCIKGVKRQATYFVERMTRRTVSFCREFTKLAF